MTLKGNLRDFSSAQLLNLIHLAHKTGVLTVEGNDGNINVYFRDGKLAYAQNGRHNSSLVTILYNSKKLNTAQHSLIKERAHNMTDKELGLILINANYVTKQDILTSIQKYLLLIINQLFIHREGNFRFENDILPPNDKITLKLNLENIILEGSRRMREWEHLREEIPSLDMCLKFADRPSSNIRNINLTTEEWKVVSYINPKNSMRQIASATRLSDFEIRHVVFSLLQAGIVEIIRPEGERLITPTQSPTLIQRKPIKPITQKSLIYRIIDRIRSL